MASDPTQTTETKPDFTDRCHYSRTGFARWEWNAAGNPYCTCKPVKAPKEPANAE